MRTYFPDRDCRCSSFLGSRGFRQHYPQLAESLEDWYDRSAENCDLFVNISEASKYSVTCTVCRHFDTQGCCAPTDKGPNIIKLLDIANEHDSSP